MSTSPLSIPPNAQPIAPAAEAFAHTNIALVKYWGKRDAALNLPAAGSLSMTLAPLGSKTRVQFFLIPDDQPLSDAAPSVDVVFAGGAPAKDGFARRVQIFLDRVRPHRSGARVLAKVETENTIPTAAGLASSASGFAALATAACAASAPDGMPSLARLSELARLGSGSAARSVFGGFVEMHPGQREDGSDAIATPILGKDGWDLRMLVAITHKGEKSIGSTEAMNHTAVTSPYYAPWVDSVAEDIIAAKRAIGNRDLAALGPVVERSCLRMHASAMAADPGILYWNGATIAAMASVKQARLDGLGAYFTIDAGPHVKVLCLPKDAQALSNRLRQVPGVLDVLDMHIGSGVSLNNQPVEAHLGHP